MRDLGWTVEAAAAGVHSEPILAASFDRLHDLPFSRSIRDAGALVAGLRATSAVLRGTEPRIVHVHTPIASFVVRLAVRRMARDRRPIVIYTAHGFHFNKMGRRLPNAAFLLAERVAGRWTDRLVVINDEDEAAARRHRLVPARRIVRHPGIGLDTSHYSATEVRDEEVARVRVGLAIEPETALFVVVGELNDNKRQGDAIAALSLLDGSDSHLVLVGDGPRWTTLQAMAAERGVTGRVHFMGLVDDVRPVLLAAHALVAPSAREGLSRSVMEALSLERPVIASEARGNAELVGDSGYVLGLGDVQAIAAAMGRVMADPETRREMGRRGRRRMVETYDVAIVAHLHETLYVEAIRERDGEHAD